MFILRLWALGLCALLCVSSSTAMPCASLWFLVDAGGESATAPCADENAGDVVGLLPGYPPRTWSWRQGAWRSFQGESPRFTYARSVYDKAGRRVLLLLNSNDGVWTRASPGWTRIAESPDLEVVIAFVYDTVRAVPVAIGKGSGGETRFREFVAGAWVSRPLPPETPMQLLDAVFDEARGVYVATQYANAQRDVETWEFGPGGWRLVSVTRSPDVASGYLYDRARGVTVKAVDGTSVWEWDGAAWSLRTALDAAGSGIGWITRFVYDPTLGRTVWWGGVETSGAVPLLRGYWAWTGDRFEPLNEVPQTLTRCTTADTARGVVVAYGHTGALTNEFPGPFEYSDGRWKRARPALRAPTTGVKLAFDAQRAVTVLVTDDGADGTWLWDGSAWVSGPGYPGRRSGCALAYDPFRGRVQLFGGRSETGLRGELLEWTGSEWVVRASDAPPLERAVMEFDRRRGVLVIVGGRNDSGISSAIWEYGSGGWRSIAIPVISPLLDGAIVFDPRRQAIVVQGGQAAFSTGTTALWDGECLQVLGYARWRLSPFGESLNRRYFDLFAEPASGRLLGLADGEVSFLDAAADRFTPANQSSRLVREGQGVALTSGASFSGLEFRWRRNGTPIENNGRFAGASTANLTIVRARPGDTGRFTLEAFSACCSETTDAVDLTVLPCAGDANIDGSINMLDLTLVLLQFGQTGFLLDADLNDDGTVDFADLNLVLGNFGAVCPSP